MKFRFNYFFIFFIVFLVSTIGSYFTSKGMDWYNTISKPNFIPASWVFGVVWTILFVLIAISIIIFWNKVRHNNYFYIVISMFVVNAILNVLWSYVFFFKHFIDYGFLVAIILEISIVSLILLMHKKCSKASYYLIPYALWVLFAIFLNYSILIINI